METIPEVVLPKELLDAPYTLGPLKKKLEDDLYVTVAFLRERRQQGRLVKERYNLRCRVINFYTDAGVDYANIRVEDPEKPKAMYEMQTIKTSLLPTSAVERVQSAMRKLAAV